MRPVGVGVYGVGQSIVDSRQLGRVDDPDAGNRKRETGNFSVSLALVFRRFIRVESASGVVLLIAAVAALIWANAPFGESYEEFWTTAVNLNVGSFHLDETLRGVVNDGLMAIFFFVVGLEIKRELVAGDLRDKRTAVLPAIAAMGGMVVPALIYFAFNVGTTAEHGWGIPMATDIAFAVGVVTLLGSRIPLGGRLFLLALAIVDDIGAIVVIAIFYTEQVSIADLALSMASLGVIWGALRIGVRSLFFHIPAALAAWFFLLESGVHPTLAGVAIGLLIPVGSTHGEDASNEPVSPLHPTRDRIPPVVLVCGRADLRSRQRRRESLAGVDLVEAVTNRVSLGVSVGLIVGKTAGITLFTWLAVRFGIGVLPGRSAGSMSSAWQCLAGIGFTVSLFVAGLSFTDAANDWTSPRSGIFIGSLLAGTLGYLILRTSPASKQEET